MASPLFLREAAGAADVLLRQLYDDATGSFTYLLADTNTGQGVLIDPVFEQHSRDWALIRELGIELLYSLDTHVHADHVTGSWLMQQSSGCGIGLAASAGAQHVTLPLRHGDRIGFGNRWLAVRSTPGHTDGCLSFVLDNQQVAFTGDALLVRGCGRSDFQQGSASKLWTSINEQLLTLPPSCLLYPAHDYTGRQVTSVAEEQRYNARFGGGATERDFLGHMQHMRLPHPKRLAEALPGNLRSGRPLEPQSAPGWAPICHSYAGLPELTPDWVANHQDELTLLDVRTQEEFEGPDGHIAGSELIPLAQLQQRLHELPEERPLVLVCHAGSRSALATQQLLQSGRVQVANLRGGLKRWSDEGYPLQGRIDL